MAYLASQVPKVPEGKTHKFQLILLDQRKVRKVYRAHRATLDQPVILDHEDHPGHLDLQAFPDKRETKVTQVFRDKMVDLDNQAFQE